MNRMLHAVTITLNPAVDCMINVPHFATGKVNRATGMHQQPGGKGVNVAFSLAALGHHVAVTGFLGRDNSSLFEAQFQARQVDDHFVRLPGSTRLCMKLSDPLHQETTDVNLPGLCPDPAALAQLQQTMRSLEAPWFVLSGSLPEGVAPDLYAQWITQLKARGLKVMLDTSGEALRAAIAAVPAAIKPNVHELSALVGATLDSHDKVKHAARELVQQGIELVVVSMGEDGALFVTRDETLLATPPVVNVHSTVGAGDAMVAGIIAGALRGLSLADQARLATACSLQVITRDNAAEHSPESFFPAIMIT